MTAPDLAYCPRPTLRNGVVLCTGLVLVAVVGLVSHPDKVHHAIAEIQAQFTTPSAITGVSSQEEHAELHSALKQFANQEADQEAERVIQEDTASPEAEFLVSSKGVEAQLAHKLRAAKEKDQDKKMIKRTDGPWRQTVSFDNEKKAGDFFKNAASSQKQAATKADTEFKGDAKASRHIEDVKRGYQNDYTIHHNQNTKVVNHDDDVQRGGDLVKESHEKSKLQIEAQAKARKKALAFAKNHPVKAKKQKEKKEELPDQKALGEGHWPIRGGNPPWANEKTPGNDKNDPGLKKKVKAPLKMPPKFEEPVFKKPVKKAAEQAVIKPRKKGVLVRSIAKDKKKLKKKLAEVTKKLDAKIVDEISKPTHGEGSKHLTSTINKHTVDNSHVKSGGDHLSKVLSKNGAGSHAAVTMLLEEFPKTFKIIRKGLRPMKSDTDAAVKKMIGDSDSDESQKSERKNDGHFLEEPTAFGPWLLN